MTSPRYATPAAFQHALEQRLRNESAGTDLARCRQLLVFDRFLARVVRVLGDAVVVKGGLVLELRLARARTTRDIDLRLVAAPTEVLLRLQEAGRQDLGDFLAFEVQPDAHHPDILAEGMHYAGQRYRAFGKLAGKAYGQPFGVDVAFAEPMAGAPDVVTAADTLAFAGIAPPTLRLCPIETHIAEKLHAYTLPRSRVKSRVKDLPDLALLATIRSLDAALLRQALALTFGHRATHALVQAVPAPPDAWAAPYARMAQENELRWPDLDAVLAAVQGFLDPVLGGAMVAHWNPQSWSWACTER